MSEETVEEVPHHEGTDVGEGGDSRPVDRGVDEQDVRRGDQVGTTPSRRQKGRAH